MCTIQSYSAVQSVFSKLKSGHCKAVASKHGVEWFMHATSNCCCGSFQKKSPPNCFKMSQNIFAYTHQCQHQVVSVPYFPTEFLQSFIANLWLGLAVWHPPITSASWWWPRRSWTGFQATKPNQKSNHWFTDCFAPRSIPVTRQNLFMALVPSWSNLGNIWKRVATCHNSLYLANMNRCIDVNQVIDLA